MNVICKKIKKLRADSRLTQYQLGEIIGVSEKVISKWENGETLPSADHIPAIADAFNISTDELFDRQPKEYSNIKKTVYEYIKAFPTETAMAEVHKLYSYMVIGMEMRSMTDSGLYDDSALKEIHADLIGTAEAGDCRIQYHSPTDNLKDGSAPLWNKHYLRDAAWSVERNGMKLCVLQEDGIDYTENILNNGYEPIRNVFEVLSLPDAEKLLAYFLTTDKAKRFTVEYVAKRSGADVKTTEKFIEMLFSLRSNTNELIIEKNKALICEKETDIFYYAPGAFESILRSVVLIASVLCGERYGFR